MFTSGRRESSNVEDRRSFGPVAVGGGLGTIAMVFVAMLLGIDPRIVINNAPQSRQVQRQEVPAGQEDLKKFVGVVLADTEDVWNELLPKQAGQQYREPKLVLFSGSVESACGMAGAAVGPFYCPPDENLYIDLSFYKDMRDKLGAPGDFAQAYVIAHEVGHHVQNLLGTMERRAPNDNEASVRVELQADFYAGVWAHYAARRGLLEAGDIEEALNAASAIGDDRLQMKTQGRVVPDSFTHGTSEQRMRWFKRGFDTGDVRQGDTFKADHL